MKPVVEVWDMSGDGTGPWRLLVNGFGVATWPASPEAQAYPEAYANEVCRVACLALGVETTEVTKEGARRLAEANAKRKR